MKKAALLSATMLALTCEGPSDAPSHIPAPAEHGGVPAAATSASLRMQTVSSCARVFCPVTGRVVGISVHVGDRVRKGDALVTIEPPDIDGFGINEVHKAEADLIAAEHDSKRKKELFRHHAALATEVEAAEDAYRRAKAEVERARLREVLRGPVPWTAEAYTLTAPIDGQIVSREVTVGDLVYEAMGGGVVPAALFVIRPAGAERVQCDGD